MTVSQAVVSVRGVQVLGPFVPETAEVLTPEALAFLAALHRKFNSTRRKLMAMRDERQERLDFGEQPEFLHETAGIRESDWRIGPIPADLTDRRVEITGPVDRKMVINALNSGAKVYMADFEDAHSPTWEATMQGQVNVRDAINGSIEYTSPEGKEYRLNPTIATLMVRPRGWHLHEKHVTVDGEPMSASLFDFGLAFFHNAQTLVDKGSGPYYYLPKLESHLEARLWNDVFLFAQKQLDLPRGTIKATVLIETILAAFEMDEILWELREHSAGLNCGRWDYIFSFIKKFRQRAGCVLPDRALVTMTTHFMHCYSLLAIKTCHRRGAHAMGGMAAQIPIKNDPAANETALAKVRADKQREASDGHDGTWVAHPGLVPVALEMFDKYMPQPNQIDRQRDDVQVTAADLLKCPAGPISEAGLRLNCNVAVRYLESWLRGTGCVPIFNLMEDAATAEISRAQVWQWIHHATGVLTDGRKIDVALVRRIMSEEMDKIRQSVGEDAFTGGQYKLAARLFDDLSTSEQFTEFLTLPAYQYLP